MKPCDVINTLRHSTDGNSFNVLVYLFWLPTVDDWHLPLSFTILSTIWHCQNSDLSLENCNTFP